MASKLLYLQAGCAPRESFISFVMAEFTVAPLDRLWSLRSLHGILEPKGP